MSWDGPNSRVGKSRGDEPLVERDHDELIISIRRCGEVLDDDDDVMVGTSSRPVVLQNDVNRK